MKERYMPNHIVSSFDAELQGLASRIAEMSGLTERLVADSVTALVTFDAEMAQEVVAADRQVDEMQHESEAFAVSMIARRQPMANDLRTIISAMRICHNLERVGDLAKNIAKRALAIEGQFANKNLVTGVEHLTSLAQRQLKNSIDSYTTRDIALAKRVINNDNEIDVLYTSLFRELLTYMMEDPRKISACTHLLFCAKNIERIGDHATNIAEEVLYLVTGEPREAGRPKKDASSYAIVDYEGVIDTESS